MAHPLVDQVRFARSELQRGLAGVTDEEARRRFMPMNSISWIVGHLAFQENIYWMVRAQGRNIAPQLQPLVGWDMPASTPPLDEMWAAWNTIVQASDPYLDSLTTETLTTHMIVNGQPHVESVGTMLRRVAYHYFYHLGEAMAIRQLLGHTGLPEFVGDIGIEAPYRPE
jgi:hypothetical protein